MVDLYIRSTPKIVKIYVDYLAYPNNMEHHWFT